MNYPEAISKRQDCKPSTKDADGKVICPSIPVGDGTFLALENISDVIRKAPNYSVRVCPEDDHHIGFLSINQGALNPLIMVVMQDWGPLGDYYFQYEKDGRFNGHTRFPYSSTYKTLQELLQKVFAEPELDIMEPDKKKRFFFTNLVLCLRCIEGKDHNWIKIRSCASGNFSSSWSNTCAKKHFNNLVEAVRPKMIIIMGDPSFKAIIKSFDPKKWDDIKNKSFSEIIDSEDDFFLSLDGTKVPLFPIWHTSNQGKANRTRHLKKEGSKDDWKRIQEHLSSLTGESSYLNLNVK